MDPDELRRLVAQPESEVLEFKLRLPDSDSTAKLLAAFANTRGGTLVVGVAEGSKIVGLDNPEQTRRLLDRAAEAVYPRVNMQSEIVTLDEKPVLVAEVSVGELPPYLVHGQALQRVRDRLVPITSSVLYDNIKKRVPNSSNESVLAEVRHLAEVVEQQNKNLIAARSWRRKIPEMILGGVIGVLIATVFNALLGWG